MRDLFICCGIGLNMFFPVYFIIPAKRKVITKDYFFKPKNDKVKGHQTVAYNRTQYK